MPVKNNFFFFLILINFFSKKREIYDEYVIAAKLYIENGGLYPIKGEEDVKRAVFFGKMPYNMENQDLFRKVWISLFLI